MSKHRMQFEFGWAVEVEASRVSIYASLESAITLTTEQSYDLVVWLIRELGIYDRLQAWRVSDQVRIDALELELADRPQAWRASDQVRIDELALDLGRAKRRAKWYKKLLEFILEQDPSLITKIARNSRYGKMSSAYPPEAFKCPSCDDGKLTAVTRYVCSNSKCENYEKL